MSYPHVAKALRYARSVISGRIKACKWVNLACQRQLKDLERSNGNWPYAFDRDRAERICRFSELMPHVKGPLAKKGETIKLRPFQCFGLTTVFGWVKKREPERRRFRRVYWELPRGNAKSTLSSIVGLYMLAADGEIGADCYSAAVKNEQAKIVFGDAQAMARMTSEYRRKYGVEVGANSIFAVGTNSKFKTLTGDDKGLDGLNIHFGCIDELHKHRRRQVYDVVETAAGKRDNSLIWMITTAGSDRSGICYEVRSDLCKVLEGIYDDEQFWGIIYGIDDEDDWASDDTLKKANPNWGVSVDKDYVLELREKAKRVASAQSTFLTKHLNVWVGAELPLFNAKEWQACADRNLQLSDFEGQPCVAGLDMAIRHDFSALVLLFKRDDKYCIFARYYLAQAEVEASENAQYSGWARQGFITATPGNTTDFQTIKRDILEASKRFSIREIAYDRTFAEQFAQEMMDEGMTMVEIGQRAINFVEPVAALGGFMADKKIVHNGDPVFTWMLSNVARQKNRQGSIYPTKEKPENKIDGPIALFMALRRRSMLDEGSHGSVYDTREPLVFDALF